MGAVNDLFTHLHEKQAVLRGWTAALSLTEEAVEAIVHSVWPGQKVAVAWAESVDPGEGERNANVSSLELELEAPRITLGGDANGNIVVRQPVKTAALKIGLLAVSGPASGVRVDPDDARVSWSAPAPVASPQGASLQTTTRLAVAAGVRGGTADVHSVVLDLANAAFDHGGLDAASADHIALAARIGSVIADGQAQLRIASLDLSAGANGSAFQPSSLQLNVAQATSGARFLQLLVGGPDGPPKTRSIAVDEPVPGGSNMDFSLLVASAPIIDDLVTQFNQGPALVKLVAVDSGVASYAQTRNSMQYSGTVTFGKAYPPVHNNATLNMYLKGTASNGLALSGVIEPDSNLQLQLGAEGDFPVTVSGTGSDQTVSLTAGRTSVTATGMAENAVKDRLEGFVGDISSGLTRISLKPVTDLLLNRLVLPGRTPTIQHAQIPGDLVLLGTLDGPGESTADFSPSIPSEPQQPTDLPSANPMPSRGVALDDSAASLNNLLTQMVQNQEVLQGWDAVMNFLESSVNQFLQSQWNQQTGGTNSMNVSAIWCGPPTPISRDAYITTVTEFKIALGAPLFQFASGSSQITVTQNILSGTLRQGTKSVPSNFDPSTQCNCVWDDPSVMWGDPVTIETSANPTFSGTVDLQQVQGLVSSTASSLILDFSTGAFTLGNMTISGVNDNDIVDQIKDWFNANNIKYILASVDMANLTGQTGLTPTQFQFNVVNTNAGNTVVQLFITTDGSPQPSLTVNVNEPVPTADGLTCSLMISSRIVFNDVLIAGFSTPNAQFTLVPVVPGSLGQIWGAAIQPEMNFSGSFTFGNCCDSTTDTYNIWLGGTYGGSATDGFVLTQNVTTGGNAPVTINVWGANPVSLSGSGNSQLITITPQTPSVNVTGSVEDEITSTLTSILTNDFQGGMAGISFSAVTFFALKNLLFPGNLIQMSQVQAPGDLLIVGTFTPPS